MPPSRGASEQKEIVEGRLNAERLLLLLGSGDNKDVLHEGMGTELFIQIFTEAKKKLSRELISSNESSALLLLKQLKLLYAMLSCKPFGTRLHKCFHCRCPQRFEKSHHQSFCKRRKTITWYSTADTWRSSTHLQKNNYTRWCRVQDIRRTFYCRSKYRQLTRSTAQARERLGNSYLWHDTSEPLTCLIITPTDCKTNSQLFWEVEQ